MGSLGQDIRYGLRVLRTQPGFTLIVVTVLALGIGANSAIFSVFDAVVLRPLPYPESERLVSLEETNPLQERNELGVSYPNFLDWQSGQHSVFTALGAYRSTEMIVKVAGEREPIVGAQVTGSVFATLGVQPVTGRMFLPEEEEPGGACVATASRGFWLNRLGGDPALQARSILIDDASCAVIGVMRPAFRFPSDETEVWLALGTTADEREMTNRAVHTLQVVARRAPDVTIERSRAEMSAIAARIERDSPEEDPGHAVRVVSLQDQMVGSARPSLMVLSAAVALVLLIACVNVGSLLLARASTRRREIAIRAALGGSGARIARLLLVESVLLAARGGALGLVVLVRGVDVLRGQLETIVPRVSEIGINGRVLGFTALVALATGLGFGLVPALQAFRAESSETLCARGHGDARRRRLGGMIVTAEIALAIVPLVASALLLQSFWRLRHVDPGFAPENLATMAVALPSSYETIASVVSFYRGVCEKLEALPSAQAASAVSYLPITGSDGQGELTIEGRPFAPGEAPGATFRRALPDYFSTLRIPLVRGREFDDRDDGRTGKVVIINQAMARRHWPDDDPLGKRIKIGPAQHEPWLTIVGVVGDVKNDGLQTESRLATYEPYAQRPRLAMTLVVRTAGDPTQMIPLMRNVVRSTEPDITIFDAGTMEQRMASSLASQRFQAVLLGSFGAIALILAALGVYGVIAHTVAQRTREIGVRIALGAHRADVLRLVVGRGMASALLGVALGLAFAFAAVRASASFSSLLFEVKATDPATFLAIALLLLVVALVACWIPAQRATRVDPLVALRYG